MKCNSSKFKTVSLQWLYPVFVPVINSKCLRRRSISCGRINVPKTAMYLMREDMRTVWWTVCCKSSAWLKHIAGYLFNVRRKYMRCDEKNISNGWAKWIHPLQGIRIINHLMTKLYVCFKDPVRTARWTLFASVIKTHWINAV